MKAGHLLRPCGKVATPHVTLFGDASTYSGFKLEASPNDKVFTWPMSMAVCTDVIQHQRCHQSHMSASIPGPAWHANINACQFLMLSLASSLT